MGLGRARFRTRGAHRALRFFALATLGLFASGCASTGPAGGHAGIDPAARAPAGVTPVEEGAPDRTSARHDAEHPDPGVLPPGVRVFTADGTPSSWEALLAAAGDARVVLLGEIHDDVVGHRARHALLRALAGGAAAHPAWRTVVGPDGPERSACAPHVVSLEMLETDVQLVVDEYQAGFITADHFRRAARPWDNHDRDYEPYLAVARACGFPVVAANPPRRYVNRVARLGEGALQHLAPEALATLPPLPVAPPTERYRAQWNALMGGGAGHGAAPTHGAPAPHDVPAPPLDPVLQAQNVWDAGMAWAVARAAGAHPEARIVHVAGAFHVQDRTGIPEHLERYLPGASILVVVAYPETPGAAFDEVRHGGKGDFVLLTER
jgi:uncharacterized iron-regulated protein